MNTKPTPSYLVYHNDQVNTPTRTFFAHEDLLTARKAAWTYAESLFGSQATFSDEDEISIYLVESKGKDDPEPTIVAQILKKRTTWVESDKDHVYYQNIIHELNREYYYYSQHQIPDGFGSFRLSLFETSTQTPSFEAQIIFDALPYAMVAVSNFSNLKGLTFSLVYYQADEVAPVSLLS